VGRIVLTVLIVSVALFIIMVVLAMYLPIMVTKPIAIFQLNLIMVTVIN
jgi:hypothetical protein